MTDKWVLAGIASLVCTSCGIMAIFLTFRIAALILIAVGLYFAVVLFLVLPESRHKNVRP